MINDLNSVLIDTDRSPIPQSDCGVDDVAFVEVVFKRHKARLIEEIVKYPIIIGCVAWLTDRDVLAALATRDGVSIIVQKEDFLRPDKNGSASEIRRMYEKIKPVWRAEIENTAMYSSSSCDELCGVRCAGNHNSNRSPAFPRMHNKFLVFCEAGTGSVGIETHSPKKVWTGSYNISDNATRSWENVVLIESVRVAKAYAAEYGQIFGLSEPLDWESPWVAPEYRIGT